MAECFNYSYDFSGDENQSGEAVVIITTIEQSVFYASSILAGAVVVFAIICLIFNIVFRNKK